MVKYIINGRFLTKQITGVQRYAYELILELDKIVDMDFIEIAVPIECINIPQLFNIKVVKTGKLKGNLWEQISFPLYVSRKKAISINLCNTAPLLNPGIVCIHDVKIKAKPEYFSKKFLLWYNLLFKNEINRSKMIITVSEFSKSEIIKYYHVEVDKIKVIYNAWQHFERITFDNYALKKYELETNQYYFSMSSLEPNKNFKWIAEMAKKNSNEIFAVAGSINKKVFSEGLGFECPINMKLLGYISDEEAKTLMKNCKAFLFPSFYEGFGIPPLEAMSAGARQIVVSDIPVMHEIFEQNVIYIDPNEIENCQLKTISTKKKNNQIILSKYSWEKSAFDLLSIISYT